MFNKAANILIISETFKLNSGGGITLSNLFKGYPKECLANAIDSKELSKIHSNEICNNFYGLGSKEKKVLKVLSFLQKKNFSGKYIFSNINEQKIFSNTRHKSFRDILVEYFFLFLHFIGIYNLLYSYEISDDLKKWVEEFNPDYIYTQLSSRELIHFSEKLINLTGASLAIHIMDDWPSTISKNGLFKQYWHKKIDSEFRNLLDKADVLMSISEGMTIEYKIRYSKEFIPFHNPIEVNDWSQFSKHDLSINPNDICVLYGGRIGLGTSDSIIEIAKAIEELKKEGLKISFYIQSTTCNSDTLSKLKKISCVILNPIVQYAELPKIFSSADVLVMPIDFSKKGIEFLKYSMPTKASEYMISGTPILLYSDKKISIVEHAEKYGWALVVTNHDINMLKSELTNIINNMQLRTKLSKTAINHATVNYDSKHVREMFRKQFSKHS